MIKKLKIKKKLFNGPKSSFKKFNKFYLENCYSKFKTSKSSPTKINTKIGNNITVEPIYRNVDKILTTKINQRNNSLNNINNINKTNNINNTKFNNINSHVKYFSI